MAQVSRHLLVPLLPECESVLTTQSRIGSLSGAYLLTRPEPELQELTRVKGDFPRYADIVGGELCLVVLWKNRDGHPVQKGIGAGLLYLSVYCVRMIF
jgi:hypothetical protein